MCLLLECERTKTKILYFYKGKKWLPFKKGPKLCASDFGDVQKNMIYLVWRSPAFEGPIFMLEQERWQRWLKKSKANLANIVTLWDCPCRAPAYAHDGPLLSWGSKQGEKMRANDNFQDIITLCDVLSLWLSRSLCPWWPNLHNQQILPTWKPSIICTRRKKCASWQGFDTEFLNVPFINCQGIFFLSATTLLLLSVSSVLPRIVCYSPLDKCLRQPSLSGR